MMSVRHHLKSGETLRQNPSIARSSLSTSSMAIAHKALRDQMFRNTLMSTSDAVLLFDVGAGQVGTQVSLERPQADCVGDRHRGVDNSRKTAIL